MLLSQLSGYAPAIARTAARSSAPATAHVPAAQKQEGIETILGGSGDAQSAGAPNGGAEHEPLHLTTGQAGSSNAKRVRPDSMKAWPKPKLGRAAAFAFLLLPCIGAFDGSIRRAWRFLSSTSPRCRMRRLCRLPLILRPPPIDCISR